MCISSWPHPLADASSASPSRQARVPARKRRLRRRQALDTGTHRPPVLVVGWIAAPAARLRPHRPTATARHQTGSCRPAGAICIRQGGVQRRSLSAPGDLASRCATGARRSLACAAMPALAIVEPIHRLAPRAPPAPAVLRRPPHAPSMSTCAPHMGSISSPPRHDCGHLPRSNMPAARFSSAAAAPCDSLAIRACAGAAADPRHGADALAQHEIDAQSGGSHQPTGERRAVADRIEIGLVRCAHTVPG